MSRNVLDRWVITCTAKFQTMLQIVKLEYLTWFKLNAYREKMFFGSQSHNVFG